VEKQGKGVFQEMPKRARRRPESAFTRSKAFSTVFSPSGLIRQHVAGEVHSSRSLNSSKKRLHLLERRGGIVSGKRAEQKLKSSNYSGPKAKLTKPLSKTCFPGITADLACIAVQQY